VAAQRGHSVMAVRHKGNATFASLKQRLNTLPRTVAVDVARRASPQLTALTQEAFSGGSTVYGEARPLGVDGKPLDLQRTGAVAGQLRFTTNGTIVRAVLGPKYSRYLIGKYGVLPNGSMPVRWRSAMAQLVKETKPQ
jgi:hypothetical protein